MSTTNNNNQADADAETVAIAEARTVQDEFPTLEEILTWADTAEQDLKRRFEMQREENKKDRRRLVAMLQDMREEDDFARYSDDVGNPNYPPTSLKSDSTTPEEEEEEEGPAPTTPTPGEMVQTPLKSSLKPDGMTTPDPLSFRQRLGSLLGSSTKKGRVSFTKNQIEEFETSPTERYVHTVEKHVPIWDEEVFLEWYNKLDPVFVKDFTDDAVKGMDPNIVCQTLHIAECKGVLKDIPYKPLRKACLKAFPKYKNKFPRLHQPTCIEKLRQCLKESREDESNQGKL